jgi:hypothetical protein
VPEHLLPRYRRVASLLGTYEDLEDGARRRGRTHLLDAGLPLLLESGAAGAGVFLRIPQRDPEQLTAARSSSTSVPLSPCNCCSTGATRCWKPSVPTPL